MRLKTSYFNKTLFFNMITRFWPLWAVYTAIWLIILPLGLHGELRFDAFAGRPSAVLFILNAGLYGGVVMSVVFAALTAAAVFGFMYNAKSASAFASLPIRRSAVFTSVLLSGLACLFAANIVTLIAAFAVEIAYGFSGLGCLFIWLGLVCICNVFFYGFALFIAQLTGHAFAFFSLYFVLNFAAVGAESVVRYLLESIVYGMSASETTLGFLSPMIYIFDKCSVMTINNDGSFYFFSGWGTMIAYCVAGLLFTAGALLLFRKRRVESAADVVAVNVLKPVFKYCMAAAGSLTVGAILFSITSSGDVENPVVPLIVCVLTGAFIGWFAAQMLLKKNLRVFRQGWAGYTVVAVIAALLIIACEFDIFGYERRLPDPSAVSSVILYSGGEYVELRGEDGIVDTVSAHAGIIANKKLHEGASYSRYAYPAAGRIYFSLDYQLKNGKTLSRHYRVLYDDYLPVDKRSDISNINKAFNCREGIEYRTSTSVPITEKTIINAWASYYSGSQSGFAEIEFTAAQAYELYEKCIVPDIYDGNLGLVWIGGGAEHDNRVFNCRIFIDVAESRRDGMYNHAWFSVEPTTDSVRTVEWLTKHGVKLQTYYEYYSETDSDEPDFYKVYYGT